MVMHYNIGLNIMYKFSNNYEANASESLEKLKKCSNFSKTYIPQHTLLPHKYCHGRGLCINKKVTE